MVEQVGLKVFDSYPDVGNFLTTYAQSKNIQRQQQADQQAKTQFDQQNQQFQWQKENHDAAAKAAAIDEAIGPIQPGDAAGFESAKQRLIANKVITPEEAAQYNINHLRDIHAKSAQWRQIQDFNLSQQTGQSALQTAQAQRGLIGAQTNAANAQADYVRSNKGFPNGKPLSPSVQAAEDKDVEALNAARTLQQKTQGWYDAFTKGGLQTGLASQGARVFGNATGLGTTNSRELQLFQSDLESMRNDSLRLNSGVQTEGDAQREWSALIANVNDQTYVEKALQRINALNKRAEALKFMQINLRRQRNGAEPLHPQDLNAGPGADLSYMGNSDSGLKEGDTGVSKSGKPIIVRGGKWVYR